VGANSTIAGAVTSAGVHYWSQSVLLFNAADVGGLNIGLIVGVAIGGVVVIAFWVLIVCVCVRRRRARAHEYGDTVTSSSYQLGDIPVVGASMAARGMTVTGPSMSVRSGTVRSGTILRPAYDARLTGRECSVHIFQMLTWNCSRQCCLFAYAVDNRWLVSGRFVKRQHGRIPTLSGHDEDAVAVFVCRHCAPERAYEHTDVQRTRVLEQVRRWCWRVLNGWRSRAQWDVAESVASGAYECGALRHDAEHISRATTVLKRFVFRVSHYHSLDWMISFCFHSLAWSAALVNFPALRAFLDVVGCDVAQNATMCPLANVTTAPDCQNDTYANWLFACDDANNLVYL
jgi:hypothetical protein